MKNKNISKFLSLVLRHQPEKLNLSLDTAGWTEVNDLLQKLNNKGYEVDRAKLEEVVATNDKQRFAFSKDGTKIRANQGHSIPIALEYAPTKPPAILYHGTALKNKESILQSGITKHKRHHVHLSADKSTATNVGQRHGKPIIFVINTEQMHKDGILFYRSDNGVWLTDEVHPKYLNS